MDAANDKQKNRLRTTSGGLWMIIHGFDAIGPESTTIRLPNGIVPNPVDNLNHAYTKLSELFEPWRISHDDSIHRDGHTTAGAKHATKLGEVLLVLPR